MRNIIVFIIILVLLFLVGGTSHESYEYITCTGSPGRDGGELYYYPLYDSNFTSASISSCIVRNHTEDEINRIARENKRIIDAEIAAKNKACYDAGFDINKTFDLIKDYGYSCRQIEYLNDNFLLDNERKDAGSISGEYNGFFSHGYISGEFYQWVNVHNVATGKLIKYSSEHEDCNGIHTNLSLEYYSEQDFIMYYVTNCLE